MGVLADKYHEIYVQIGLNIMRYRKERKLTQEQLADRIGYSRQQVQRVETAVTAPSLAILLDISEALQVPLERLIAIK